MGGVAVDTAGIEPWAIAGDRRGGLIEDSGQKITAREVHSLLRFRAEVLGEDTIRIRDRDGASILVAAPSAQTGYPSVTPARVSHAWPQGVTATGHA